MTINSLFKKRKRLYYKDLLKYFRYIFNDHFSLVLFFIIGAGGYAYSNYLETVSYGSVQPRIILILFYFLLATTGTVTLVVEKADQIYLLPKEEEFYPILKDAIFKSYLQSLVPLAFVSFITFPIYVQTQQSTIREGFFLFLILASLKWGNLLVKVYPYFYQKDIAYRKYQNLMYLITFSGIISMNFLSITGTAVLVTALAIISSYFFYKEKIYFNHSLKWEAIIKAEEARLHKLYQFIQLFMDVPEMEPSVKRLRVFDPLLQWLSTRHPKAPYYYLLRTAARNTEYSLLTLRLTLIGSLLILSMDSYWFSVIVTLLFIYMLGFQLIALVKEIDRVPQFRFYPVIEKEKVHSALYLTNQLLQMMTLFFTISAVINHKAVGVLVLPLGLFSSYLFSYYYVPFRLKE